MDHQYRYLTKKMGLSGFQKENLSNAMTTASKCASDYDDDDDDDDDDNDDDGDDDLSNAMTSAASNNSAFGPIVNRPQHAK